MNCPVCNDESETTLEENSLLEKNIHCYCEKCKLNFTVSYIEGVKLNGKESNGKK